MTDEQYAQFRRALRSPARPLVLALEGRGLRFELVMGRVVIRPAARLTAEDRAALRALKPKIRLLVLHRRRWYDWATSRLPSWPEALAGGPVVRADEHGGRGPEREVA